MKITIYGTGYVGLVTAIGFAELGHDILCVDTDAKKITALQQNKIPFFEPGLEAALLKNQNALRFTTSAEQGVSHGIIQCIAVGTPPKENGAADLRFVESVVETVTQYASEYRIIMTKSTVPVGTAHHIERMILNFSENRRVALNIDVVSNPEFLREGSAVSDVMHPERIVIGTSTIRAQEIMRALYLPLLKQCLFMDVLSAELSKYAANAMLASRISFVNEIARVSEAIGADITEVKKVLATDHRIGPHFLNAGCAYGGSCFPKDVTALTHFAEEFGVATPLLHAIDEVNCMQRHLLSDKCQKIFGKNLTGLCVAIWGLSFKPNTDDIREAPSLYLIDDLIAMGARINVFDPVAMENVRNHYSPSAPIEFAETALNACVDADVLILVTEWPEFTKWPLQKIKSTLKNPIIIDGRNVFDSSEMAQAGLYYYSIGRPAIEPAPKSNFAIFNRQAGVNAIL